MAIDFIEDAPSGLDFQPDPEPASPEKLSLQAEMQKLREDRDRGDLMESVLGGAESIVERLTPAGILNQPARLLGYADPYQQGTPAVDLPEPSGTGFMSGVGQLASRTGEALTTPESLLTLPFAGVAPIRALFAGQMAQHLPEQIAQGGEVLRDPNATTAEKVVAAGSPLVTAALTRAAGRTGQWLPDPLRPELDIPPNFPTRFPTPIRELGIRVPEGPFAQPGIAELADAALRDKMSLVKDPRAMGAELNELRRAMNPPQIEPATIALAERIEGGGEAPYGRVSYQRAAEAPLPERTQEALAIQPEKPVTLEPTEKRIGRVFEHDGKQFEIVVKETSVPGLIRVVGVHRTDVPRAEGGAGRTDLMNAIGPSGIKSAMREVLNEFPNANEIEFYRASKEGQRRYVRMPIPETEKPPAAITEGGEQVVPPKPASEIPAETGAVTAAPEQAAIREATTEMPAAQVSEGLQPTKGIITGRAIEKWADDTLRGGATHLGPDVLAAYMVKGAALIERGVINFAEWSARMIDAYGESIKPHLSDLFAAAQATVRREPVGESGTLKSSRDIVEQRLGGHAPSPTPTPTAAPPAAPPTPPRAPTPAAPTPAPRGGGGATTLDDIYRIFEPAPKAKTPIGQRLSNVAEAVRTGFSSKFRPLNKLAEDYADAYGVAKKDLAGIFEQLKGSSGRGEADIFRFDQDVSKLIKGKEKDFNAYMFLQRSLDRLRQDAASGAPRRAVAQYDIPTLEAKLRLLEGNIGNDLPAFQRAASEFQRHMDQALQLQVDSGRMSPQVYQQIKSENQFYAPFKVMKYLENQMRPEGTGRKIDTVADYTRAMEGIEDPNFKLGDMLGAARQNLLTSRILADKANAMRNIGDIATGDTQGLFVRRLRSGQQPSREWSTVNVFENGKEVKYAVKPEVAEALQIYGPTGGGIVSSVLSKAAVPFRLGATVLNIPFQVSNLLADVPRAALVSKYGIRGVSDIVRYPLDLVESIYASMSGNLLRKPNKLYMDFLDSGAAGTTIQDYLTPEALKYREPTSMSKSKRTALNIISTPAEFAQAIEQVSKVMGVKRAMRFEGVTSGAELAKQIPEAVTEIRRFSGSPDFGRQGKAVEQARLNLLYMFLNARIQGTVADFGRLTGRDGAKTAASTWFKIGTAVGLPTAYLYALNNSPEYKADYEQRPKKEKDDYWLIPKDTFITNDQGEKMRDYWRIPKRESSKWIANMVESGLKFAEKQDPESLKRFTQQMVEDITPINIQGENFQERMESMAASLNPLIKAPIEMGTGRDLYRHRDIVPETMKAASPEQQYTQRTSEAYKVLAERMPDVAPEVLRSPLMLENLTRNMTAGLITQFLPRKPIEGRGAIENNPLMQRFQAVPFTDNEAFVKMRNELEREAADEYLARHRAATTLLDSNKGKGLPDILSQAGGDPKLMERVVDLWMAKENGITSQERQLIALPAKQRAKYVSDILGKLSGKAREDKILELTNKRVLTESVFREMALMEMQPKP